MAAPDAAADAWWAAAQPVPALASAAGAPAPSQGTAPWPAPAEHAVGAAAAPRSTDASTTAATAALWPAPGDGAVSAPAASDTDGVTRAAAESHASGGGSPAPALPADASASSRSSTSSSAEVGESGVDSAASPHGGEELDLMLRNFRLRRRLELLPGCGAPPEPEALRRLRQAWRPQRLPAEAGGAGGGKVGEPAHQPPTANDLVATVADLQQQVEEGYSALNRERRAQGALEEGLRRQGESVAAITAECDRLREHLRQVRDETQERTAENGRLGQQLGSARSSRASEQTQAAVLAKVIGKLVGDQTRAGGSSASAALVELAACRVQITTLVQENEALERSLGLARS